MEALLRDTKVAGFKWKTSRSEPDGNVTLAAATATLEPFAVLSRVFNGPPASSHEQYFKYMFVCFLSLSIRNHESFYPQFAAFCFHSAGFFRVGTLLRLWEPTGAMRLPPLNTCHPPLLRTDLGEREWGLLVRLIRAAPAHLLFYERKLILTLVWNYFFTALASLLISPVIYPKLKN